MWQEKPTADSIAPMDHTTHDMGNGETEPGWKHWGLMVLCCLPMIAIALLFAVGVWR